MLNDKPGRRQITAQQRDEAETCRHLGKGGDRLAIRARQANTFELQIELTVVPINGEAHSRYGKKEPVTRPAERFLDIGGQTIELDRTLHQAPQAERDDEDQSSRERAEPYEAAMRAAPHPGSRGATFTCVSRVAGLCVLSSGI